MGTHSCGIRSAILVRITLMANHDILGTTRVMSYIHSPYWLLMIPKHEKFHDVQYAVLEFFPSVCIKWTVLESYVQIGSQSICLVNRTFVLSNVMRYVSVRFLVPSGYRWRNKETRAPKRIWMDDIKDWTGRNVEELLRLAENRLVWSRVFMNIASPQWPHGFGTWWWWWSVRCVRARQWAGEREWESRVARLYGSCENYLHSS